MTKKAYLKVQSPKFGCKMGCAKLGDFSMTSHSPMTAGPNSRKEATTKVMMETGFVSKNFLVCKIHYLLLFRCQKFANFCNLSPLSQVLNWHNFVNIWS